MQNTITATLTAARAAETALVGAIQQAASALDTIARDPVAEALAQLSRSAKDAKARLDAARVEASTILLEALASFEGFSFEVVDSQPVAPTIEPTPEPLPAPSFVAIEFAPAPAPQDAEETVSECGVCGDVVDSVEPREDGVERCVPCHQKDRQHQTYAACMSIAAAAQEAYEQVVSTAANEGTAEPSPEAPKKPRGGKRKGK